jgi:hypothetical protein
MCAMWHCRYSSLAQASAPDLRQLMASGRSGLLPGSPSTAAGLLVQRSASSATMGKAFSRWALLGLQQTCDVCAGGALFFSIMIMHMLPAVQTNSVHVYDRCQASCRSVI